jgi:hypothetical protein
MMSSAASEHMIDPAAAAEPSEGQERARLPMPLWRPQGIVAAGVALSAMAWSLPDAGLRKGFTIRENPTLEGVLILGSWYASIILASLAGFHFGRRILLSRHKASVLGLADIRPYLSISLIAWLGVGSAYFQIIDQIGLGGVLGAFSRNTVNDLKTALYSNYDIGLCSLRYAAALAGGIALYHLIVGRPAWLLDSLNAVALLGTSAVSSRLSLVWATIIGISLWVSTGIELDRRQCRRLVLLALTVVGALWLLNYSRNAHYYAQRGADSVIMAGLSEVQAYLGSPFQVSLGVANNFDSALSGVTSQYYVDWESNLNRKSALEQLVPEMGWWALPYMAATAFAYSALAGCLLQFRGTYLFLGYPVVLYAFAEIWRLDFFREGIFYTNLIIAVVVPLVMYCFMRPRLRF